MTTNRPTVNLYQKVEDDNNDCHLFVIEHPIQVHVHSAEKTGNQCRSCVGSIERVLVHVPDQRTEYYVSSAWPRSSCLDCGIPIANSNREQLERTCVRPMSKFTPDFHQAAASELAKQAVKLADEWHEWYDSRSNVLELVAHDAFEVRALFLTFVFVSKLGRRYALHKVREQVTARTEFDMADEHDTRAFATLLEFASAALKLVKLFNSKLLERVINEIETLHTQHLDQLGQQKQNLRQSMTLAALFRVYGVNLSKRARTAAVELLQEYRDILNRLIAKRQPPEHSVPLHPTLAAARNSIDRALAQWSAY